jgi:hypothetical protein
MTVLLAYMTLLRSVIICFPNFLYQLTLNMKKSNYHDNKAFQNMARLSPIFIFVNLNEIESLKNMFIKN